LQDFAVWVASLAPGRVIYSSHLSPTGDLYIRLQNSVIILLFAYVPAMGAVLDSGDISKLYQDSVGRIEWWGGLHVSMVVLANKLSKNLEHGMDGARCVTISPGTKLSASDDWDVQRGSEILVCSASCLGILLGGMNNAMGTHQRLFESEVRLYSTIQAKSRSTVGQGKRASVPVGPARNAAKDWRSSRPKLPRIALLDLNMEVIRSLLNHIHLHAKVMLDDSNDGPNYDSGSESSEGEGGARRGGGEDGSEDEDDFEEDLEAIAEDDDSSDGGTSSHDGCGLAREDGGDSDDGIAAVDPRVRSPRRNNDLRKRWRPATPHPARVPDRAKRRMRPMDRKGARRVDFLGLGDWTSVDPAEGPKGKRGTTLDKG